MIANENLRKKEDKNEELENHIKNLDEYRKCNEIELLKKDKCKELQESEMNKIQGSLEKVKLFS